YLLHGTLFSPNSIPHSLVVVNAGAGISQRHYHRFAQWLSDQDIAVLIYDYRGIGQSRPKSLVHFHATVEDWGSKDCAAAVLWLCRRFPNTSCAVIGHSVGGFVAGLADLGNRVALI